MAEEEGGRERERERRDQPVTYNSTTKQRLEDYETRRFHKQMK